MKSDIHPQWNSSTKVTCACGNTFNTGSILADIKVEICAKCHPFYTGTQKFVDTLGRVEQFQKKSEESKKKLEVKKQVLEARAAKAQSAKTDKPSLKDLLMQARKSAS